MDDESDIPKDHETNGIPCASEWNFSISDKVTSEMIRSLNIKQRKIFQVANKWARGELKSLFILQKMQGLKNLIF